MLDEIADTDQAHDLATIHDGQVADAVSGHDRQHLVDTIVRRAGRYIGGHELVDFIVEGFGAGLGEAADYIAFRKHASQATATVYHDKHADPVFVKLTDRFHDMLG